MNTYPGFKTVLLTGALMAAPAFAQGQMGAMPPQAPQPQQYTMPSQSQMQEQAPQPQYQQYQPASQRVPQVLQPQQEGDVSYISGGIGDDEKEQLKAEESNYNFRMINSDPTGHYTADTNVTIESRDGREVVRVSGTGPLFYAKLPPGQYKVTATNGGQTETKTIRVSGSAPTDVHMVWR